MKRFNLIIGFFIMICFHILTVEASEMQSKPWECEISFDAEGGGLQFIIGKFAIEGQGKVLCEQLGTQEQLMFPILLKFDASLLAPRWAAGRIKFSGSTLKIPLESNLNPEDLLGEYYISDSNFAFYNGYGYFTGIKKNKNQLKLPFHLQQIEGFGFNFGISNLIIELNYNEI